MASGRSDMQATEDLRPFFSILIPVYNREALIMAALDSVLSQTDVSLELVAVDDGSTDSTGAILDAVAARDSRLRVFHHGSNRGEGPASNTGLDQLRGEWLVVLHSDDVLMDGALSELAELLRGSDADVVFTAQSNFVPRTGRRYSSRSAPGELASKGSFDPDEHIDELFELGMNTLSNKVFRIDYLRGRDLRFQDVERVADYLFTIASAIEARRLRVVDLVVRSIRLEAADSLTLVEGSYPTAFIRAGLGLRERLIERGFWDTWGPAVLGFFLSHIAYNLARLNSRKAQRAFIDCIRSECAPAIEGDYRRFVEEGSMQPDPLYERIVSRGSDGGLHMRAMVHRALRNVGRRFGIRRKMPKIARGLASPVPGDADGFPLVQRERTPLVSVIVDARGASEGLAACLDSLIAQTFAGFEVLAVTSASSDGAAELIRSYAERDARIRFIALPEDSEPFTARTAGLEAARGEWVSFVDASDLVLPDYLSALLGAALGSAADMSLCALCSPATESLEGLSLHKGLIVRTGEELGRMPDARGYSYSAPWAKLFRRSALEKAFAAALAREDANCVSEAIRSCKLTAESGKGLYRRTSSTGQS